MQQKRQNPENDIQLVTDIAVNKNNIDDSKILEDRADKLIEKHLI